MIYDFADAEALRLMRAFCKIDDPQTRRIVLAIVEAAARGATVKLNPAEDDAPRRVDWIG